MRVEKFCFTSEKRWSVQDFPLQNGEQTLVLVFASSKYMQDPRAIKELAAYYSDSVVIGCSTSGEIWDEKLVDGSLTVVAIEFSKVKLKLVSETIASQSDSLRCALKLGNQLAADDLKSILVFSDGLHMNGSDLARGITEVVGKEVSVAGGLAGDDHRFEHTFVICGGNIDEARVVAVGLYGDSAIIGSSSKGGWDPFGHERTITKAQGNILFELDGKRALDVYKQYLGDDAKNLPASALRFPISVRENHSSETSLVRTILSVDESTGTMTFAGDVPHGGLAQFMYGNFDRLIDAAGRAAEIVIGVSKEPVLAIAVSCVGRRLVLGDRTEEELESVMENLPPGSQMLGFYSYGELSPFGNGGCELFNESFTITTIREAA